MKNIVVLGAGMVGSAIIKDLAKTHKVVACDLSQESLDGLNGVPNVTTRQADLSSGSVIEELMSNADLAIGAVPGFMGYKMLENIIKTGTDVVDISFFPENALELDSLAKQYNVTAIVDCGVAPGMSNLLLGYHNSKMQVQNFECYVGGLPTNPVGPFNYKAPFSPADVIEEYVRPARLVENHKIVERPALSEVEHIEFSEIGTLEAFNSDGLRSLIQTMNIPDMKEKTMRYPGHAEIMKVFRETGLFDEEEIELKGQKVKPLDLTSRLLFQHWKLGSNEPEFTVMKIIVEGNESGESRRYEYNLLDRFDEPTQTSSMARTTGYTCTAAAELVLNGQFDRKGICPPEFIGESEECVQSMLSYLEQRGIVYQKSIS